jgi:hypothetical protein
VHLGGGALLAALIGWFSGCVCLVLAGVVCCSDLARGCTLCCSNASACLHLTATVCTVPPPFNWLFVLLLLLQVCLNIFPHEAWMDAFYEEGPALFSPSPVHSAAIAAGGAVTPAWNLPPHMPKVSTAARLLLSMYLGVPTAVHPALHLYLPRSSCTRATPPQLLPTCDHRHAKGLLRLVPKPGLDCSSWRAPTMYQTGDA